MKVAFQGELGAYSEGALLQHFGAEAVPMPCDTFEAVFEALEGGAVERAVLPLENSLAGSIHRNYDLLLRHQVHIVGEVIYRVRHNLLALPGVALEDIRQVLSHPQALAQCEGFLTRHHLTKVPAYDTAGSAKQIAAGRLRDTAAIAGKRAAEVYGLNILAEGIEDDPENYTRFMVLSREPEFPEAGIPAKTSIVFSLKNAPGVLFNALSVFAMRDLDLTKIESRPLRGKRWEYLFYVDFAASMNESAAQKALGHLEEIAPFLRVLGSFRRAE